MKALYLGRKVGERRKISLTFLYKEPIIRKDSIT